MPINKYQYECTALCEVIHDKSRRHCSDPSCKACDRAIVVEFVSNPRSKPDNVLQYLQGTARRYAGRQISKTPAIIRVHDIDYKEVVRYE